MKIIGFEAKGIKKLSAIEMAFSDKGIIPIKGKNRQGKTTILKAIEALLKGKKFFSADMIQHGMDKGEIKGTFEDKGMEYTVERKINGDKTTLKIQDANGMKPAKPQEFLNGFINDLTFDPQPFLLKNSAEKLKFLMKLLDIDFSEIDEKLKTLESDRTLKGREIKAKGAVADLEEVKEVSLTELLKELKEIEKFNNKQKELSFNRIKITDAIAQNNTAKTANINAKAQIDIDADERSVRAKIERDEEIARINARYEKTIAGIENDRKATLSKREEEQKLLDAKGVELSDKLQSIAVPEELKETAEVDKKIADIEETNKKAQAFRENEEKRAEIKTLQDEYNDMSDRINQLRDSKKRILARQKMPVDGMEIILGGEKPDGIYYKGTHSENWSDSEGIQLSCDLCIAMNPKLKAIFIDRGESYDSDSLKILDEWAKKNDIQAIITIVDDIPEDKEDGVFYIEEGELV